MATAEIPSGRLLLDGVSWRTYGRLLKAFDERSAVRITYDRGSLEMMTISHEHESYARFLGRLAVTLTEELGLPVKEGGSTTFRRRPLRRGLEPDNCYWIANEHLVRGKLRIDLTNDPPPDLVIEVDITHSSLERMPIYAALQVGEIWRFDGLELTFYRLHDGQYLTGNQSISFPGLNAEDVSRFLVLREQMDENAVVWQFRAWIRERIATGVLGKPAT